MTLVEADPGRCVGHLDCCYCYCCCTEARKIATGVVAEAETAVDVLLVDECDWNWNAMNMHFVFQ